MEVKNIFIISIFMLMTGEFIVDAKSWPPPPSFFHKAKMCRYLMHNADWGIVSSYSPKFQQPFGTLQSFADGAVGNSSGIPYFYIAKLSTTWQNIAYNNTISFTISEAMGDHCEKKHIDPEEPLCARLMVTGKVIPVHEHEEIKFAQSALFSRHPAMKRWPTGHGWTFCKLDLSGIYLLDFYGGIKDVPINEYFKAGDKPEYISNRHLI